MKIDRSSLKRLSRFLMRISVYVTIASLVLAAYAITMVNITQGIIGQLELIQSLDSMSEIVISSAHLVIITCLGILSSIGLILLKDLALDFLSSWKGLTNQSDTQ